MTVIDLSRKKRHGRCSTCLWHWPELNGEPGYRCYCQQSPSYHLEPPPLSATSTRPSGATPERRTIETREPRTKRTSRREKE